MYHLTVPMRQWNCDMRGNANLTTSFQREWKRMHMMPRGF